MERSYGESFGDYKLRRKIANQALRVYLRGHVIWNNGTYIKAKHGKIGHKENG